MNIKLNFSDIVDNPQCQILINNHELYSGSVQPEFYYDVPVDSGATQLRIVHRDKQPTDTVVVDGKIVRDRSFTLDRVVIDNYDIEELIWQSRFEATHGDVYQSCLFFGPNGDFILDFEAPVLRWILSTRHTRNNNDPTWERDYQYYTQACQLLAPISTK